MRVLSLVVSLALGGCMYSFVGGGLPSHIRTIAVEGLENQTAQPVLSTDLEQELEQELPRNLGVRLAAPAAAHAIVRGRVTGYEESVPGLRTGGQENQVDVVEFEVRVTAEIEIYDVREDRVLWRGSSVTGIGRYQPDQQALVGRTRALEQLAEKIIQGAQSQW